MMKGKRTKTIVIPVYKLLLEMLTPEEKISVLSGKVRCGVCGRVHDLRKDKWKECAKEVVTESGILEPLKSFTYWKEFKFPATLVTDSEGIGVIMGEVDPRYAIILDERRRKILIQKAKTLFYKAASSAEIIWRKTMWEGLLKLAEIYDLDKYKKIIEDGRKKLRQDYRTIFISMFLDLFGREDIKFSKERYGDLILIVEGRKFKIPLFFADDIVRVDPRLGVLTSQMIIDEIDVEKRTIRFRIHDDTFTYSVKERRIIDASPALVPVLKKFFGEIMKSGREKRVDRSEENLT